MGISGTTNIKFEMMKHSASAKVVLVEESKYISDIVDKVLCHIKDIVRRTICNNLTQEEQTRFFCPKISLNGNAAIM